MTLFLIIKARELSPRAVNDKNVYLNDYYAPTYFKNLNTNIGINTNNSCGYVATGMLLSFWDSYWDDNIIDERYDQNASSQFDYFDYVADSPGIKVEPPSLAFADAETYHSNLFKYSDTYFHFLLISMGDKLYGTTKGTYGMGYSNYSKLFHYYVYEYKGYITDEVEIIEESTNVRKKAIDLIKQGIPVKLGTDGHAVVAYDYDERTDSIYCHFGWDSRYTHVTIESMGYHSYNNLFAFNFKNKHNHAFNYDYKSSQGNTGHYCVCSSVLPREITVENYYLDSYPKYTWKSMICNKWFEDENIYHTLSILDSYGRAVYTKSKIFDNEYILNRSEYDYALKLSSNSYSIYVGIDSSNGGYWDDYYCVAKFDKPNRYLYKSSFLPCDWGFAGRYYFENELDDTHLALEKERKYTEVTQNGLTILTERLRCGFIENTYVVLSPRRENAGRAYLMLNFDKKVYSFMLRVCLWSGFENIDGTTNIAIKDDEGFWHHLSQIDLNKVKTKTNGLTQIIEQTPQGIFGLKIESTSSAIGTRNMGRFCIADMVFTTMSGFSNYNYIDCDYNV